MAIDYARKSQVIASGLHKKISKIDKLTYLNEQNGVIQDQQLDNEYFDLLNTYDFKDIQEARKINVASYKRTQRLRQRISDYLRQGTCLFLTLTFTNEVLTSTTAETRKKYVKNYLRYVSHSYVANIDYGSINEREHYHAVVVATHVNHEEWQYGNLDFKRIVVSPGSIKKVPKYITKLTNHAIKETTKRCCLIYSKKIKKNLEKSASIKVDIT